MTLQQYFDEYHLDADGDYDDRYENAQCFICDAQEHELITNTLKEIYEFASKAFNVLL